MLKRSLDKKTVLQDGFSMVELLIVVAVIGILAAIAVPQLSKYRVKSYNAAAHSDLKILVLRLQAFYAEHQKYPKF